MGLSIEGASIVRMPAPAAGMHLATMTHETKPSIRAVALSRVDTVCEFAGGGVYRRRPRIMAVSDF